MCYKGKCLHCLEVETGSLIFAILHVMLNAMGTVTSIGALVYMNVMYKEAVHKADEEKNEELLRGALMLGLAANVLIPILIVSFSINFAFGVCLIVGLCKRNANYVKAYFIYGVVKVVFAMTVGIYLLLGVGGPQGLLILIGGCIFIMILVMIRMTYKKFENEVVYNTFSNPLAVVAKY